MTPKRTCHHAAPTGGGARLGTRSFASCDRPRCRERATCVRDPGPCEPPADKRGNSTVLGCALTARGVRGSPADRITEEKKNSCCVTTRRHNLGILNGLRRRLAMLAARFLGLGMSGLGRGGQAMLGLSPCRLPLADLPETFRILAVALVPAPRLGLAAAPLAQAGPQPRSTPPG
jgi:hypothetical protein